MKALIIAGFLLSIQLACASDPSVRDASLEQLRNTFNFTPLPIKPAEPEPEPLSPMGDNEIIHMEKMVVTSSTFRNLSNDFDRKAAIMAENAFSFEKGGLFLSRKFGRFDANFGIWISMLPSRFLGADYPILRVDFVNLKW